MCPKYRYTVLQGNIRIRIREIIRQTCAELGVHIVKGVLAQDHVHMFINTPLKHALSYVMQRIKGRTSRRIQQEFPELKKRCRGRRFWAQGYLSTTSDKKTMVIGSEVLGSEGFRRSWSMRADHCSPRYTTRISDLPVVR